MVRRWNERRQLWRDLLFGTIFRMRREEVTVLPSGQSHCDRVHAPFDNVDPLSRSDGAFIWRAATP